MDSQDAWIGAQTASTIMNITRQYCYKLSDEKALATRQDEQKKRLCFSFLSILEFLKTPPDAEIISMADAADSGYAYAMLEIGLFFLSNDLKKNAFSCIQYAAEKGNPDAMDWLSKCYLEGIGVPENIALGLRWLGDAAAHGHVIATKKLEALNRELGAKGH